MRANETPASGSERERTPRQPWDTPVLREIPIGTATDAAGKVIRFPTEIVTTQTRIAVTAGPPRDLRAVAGPTCSQIENASDPTCSSFGAVFAGSISF